MNQQKTLNDYIRSVLHDEYDRDALDWEDDLQVNEPSQNKLTQNTCIPQSNSINSNNE